MSHGEKNRLSNWQRGYNRCSTLRTANVGPNGPLTETLGSPRFSPRQALLPCSGGLHAMRHTNLENCAILAILERRESLSPKDLRFPTIVRRWKSLVRIPRRPIEPRRSLVAPSGFSNPQASSTASPRDPLGRQTALHQHRHRLCTLRTLGIGPRLIGPPEPGDPRPPGLRQSQLFALLFNFKLLQTLLKAS